MFILRKIYTVQSIFITYTYIYIYMLENRTQSTHKNLEVLCGYLH